eukprot:2907159-Pyramimonas_sp.AAC.1
MTCRPLQRILGIGCRACERSGGPMRTWRRRSRTAGRSRAGRAPTTPRTSRTSPRTTGSSTMANAGATASVSVALGATSSGSCGAL